MQSYEYDYKKYAILYVDDEEKSLKYFERAFGKTFRILTATSAAEGYRLLEANPDQIGILLTDQRMPVEKGVQLLEKARLLCPRVLRILITAFSDYDAAIQAVNSGAIYKYLSKPWDVPELEETLRRALEFFILQQERDQLLREKIANLQQALMADRLVSVGILAAGLSHHLRNSLVPVRTFLELAPDKMQEEKARPEEPVNPAFWQDFYGQVQAQVKRILGLLNELGMASAKHAGVFTDQVELRPLLEQVTARFKEQLDARGIAVQMDVPADLPRLLVDDTQFSQLFHLLMKEELSHLPAGGRLNFRARSAPGPAGGAPGVEIEIEDNGASLPPETLNSVFDPFFIRGDDPQAFGINLMACYFIVYHHGGSIRVASPGGRGLRFTIHLPLEARTRPIAPQEQEFVAKVLMNETIWEKLLSGR